MSTWRRSLLRTGAALVAGISLGGVAGFAWFGGSSSGGKPMSDSRFTVDHIRTATDKSFEEVTKGIERQLGQFDERTYQSLVNGEDPEVVRKKIEAMAGPSGFMLFRASNHGALLGIVGQKRKAIQYLLGHPLIAIQMTQHDIRAGLYAPLRLLVYESESGRCCLEYDKPSSLFGQFGNAKVTDVAEMLDRKMERLVDEAVQ